MKKLLLLILAAAPLLSFAQVRTARSVSFNNETIGFWEYLPRGYTASGTYNYPVLIFLHGAGEKGNGTSDLPIILNSSFGKWIGNNATMNFTVNGQEHAFIVLMPQMDPKFTLTWPDFYVDAMINHAKTNLKIDANKIFLSGWSLGGGGAWQYPTTSVANASQLAGIIPVSPSPDFTDLCNIARGGVAVWAHHAVDDLSIPVDTTRYAVNTINNCPSAIPALATIYPSGGHGFVADAAYDTLNTYQYPNMFQWMIGTSRLNTVGNNQSPIAAVGNDTTVVSPSNSAILNGGASRDPNDVIVKYQWSMVSGPTSPQLNYERQNFPVTNVTGLEAGTYVFRLSVTDQFGLVATDDMTVNVSAVLPVSLNYLKGNNIGKTNHLSWSTSIEVNFDYFEIQHSADGQQYSVIGKVSRIGTDASGNYSFYHEGAHAGENFYRLNMVDKDGRSTLSKTITILNSDNQTFSIQSFPNPVKDRINVVLNGVVKGKVGINISDLQGRIVKTLSINKSQLSWKGVVDVQDLRKGTYFIKVLTENRSTQVSPFIKD